MFDVLKGFCLLILLIFGSAVAYMSWLVLLPITESDAEFRLSNVCYGGQYIATALNGADHRPLSCACVNDGLIRSVGVPTIAKGAEAMRQQLVAQMWRAASGEKQDMPDQSVMADRDVIVFMTTVQRLDRDCKTGTVAAR